MKGTTLVSVLLLAQLTIVSSIYLECVNWVRTDFTNGGWNDDQGKCLGYPRAYPIGLGRAFGTLDSIALPRPWEQNILYAPSTDNFSPCNNRTEPRTSPISLSYEAGGFGTMSKLVPGQEICLRWPAKGHAYVESGNVTISINMGPRAPGATQDLSQRQYDNLEIARLIYANCQRGSQYSNYSKDVKNTTLNQDRPCGGCFKIPENLQLGYYTFQWRVTLFPNKQYFTDCADFQIVPGELNGVQRGLSCPNMVDDCQSRCGFSGVEQCYCDESDNPQTFIKCVGDGSRNGISLITLMALVFALLR